MRDSCVQMRSHLLWFCLFALSACSARAAEVRAVHAGDDLQAALNQAKPGDELRLDAGAVFRGSFVLPAKTGDGRITMRTDLPDAS